MQFVASTPHLCTLTQKQSVVGRQWVSAPVFGCRNLYRPDTIDIVDFEFEPAKEREQQGEARDRLY
jgi:hypothetical protein